MPLSQKDAPGASPSRDVVFLVPRRADNGWRDKLWAATRKRWEQQHPQWPIFEGHHEGPEPFNRAAAINTAAAEAGAWRHAIIIDADVMLAPGQLLHGLEVAQASGKVTWPFTRWRGLAQEPTERMVRPDRPWALEQFGPGGWQGWKDEEVDWDLLVERTNPLSWSCCFIVPRSVWDDMGGFDERFRGWGYEDMAFQSLVVGLYGHERLPGDVYHLWHPRSDERQMEQGLHKQPYLENSILGRLYMIAVRRLSLEAAVAAGDQAEVARWKRDIENLERDIAGAARRLHIRPPSVRPTLEELRDGAKAGGANPYVGDRRPGAPAGQPRRLTPRRPELPQEQPDAVALVMHTDGRREYIARSVPSLEAHLDTAGIDIERRVFYDDSGDPAYRAWLVESFSEYGWYVVGPPERRGYTASMQAMQSYIERRVRAGYVLQLEDDFLYTAPVPLLQMRDVLRERSELAQVVLLRAPYYPREKKRSGILGWPVKSFDKVSAAGAELLVHDLFWSNNPNMAPRATYGHKWPTGESSERLFGDALAAEGKRFAFLTSSATIEHIGAERAGRDY